MVICVARTCVNFVTHFYTPLLRPQLFMCLLWILLQLVVVFMYWDLPPLERGKAKGNLTNKNKEVVDEQGLVEDEEEEDDEEKPLRASQELAASYGSVVTPNSTRNHTSDSTNAMVNHTSPHASSMPPESCRPSSPLQNFSLTRGMWLRVVVKLASLISYMVLIVIETVHIHICYRRDFS